MRVLLLSPLPGLDPPCGDVTYTETLLGSPPPGVEYVDYAAALRDGSLFELGRRGSSTGGVSLGRRAMVVREAAINRARRHGLLFREPFRFFEVDASRYDLVHCHVFSARIRPAVVPVVLSSGTPQTELYRDAFGWHSRRVAVTAGLDRVLAHVQDVHHTSLRLARADRVVCFTEYLEQWLTSRGLADAGRTAVVPVGVARGVDGRAAGQRAGVPRVVGFVATDFATKGGQVVLAAHDLARRVRPELELIIVGSPSLLSDSELRRRRITWFDRMPRDEVVEKLLPRMDVFAYPTNCDGSPLVLAEALACGLPAAVSDYGPLPEMVQHGRAGLVSRCGNAAALAENLLTVLAPDRYETFRQGALGVFDERFELTAAHRRLGEVYAAAVAAKGA